MISGASIEEPYGSTIRPTFLAKYLAEQGIEVSHFAMSHPKTVETVEALAEYDLLETSFKNKFTTILAKSRDIPPDVVCSHQINSAKLGLLLSFVLRVPHVYDAHSSIALEAPTFKHSHVVLRKRLLFHERMIAKLSSQIIVPSKDLKQFYSETYHLDPAKLMIVKNGADRTQILQGRPLPHIGEAHNIKKDDFLVVFTNPRLSMFPSNQMALQYLFDVIPVIESRLSRVKFLILGGGPTPKPPSENVIYTGHVDDLASYLSMANVCVAPFPPQAVCGGTRTKVCEYLAAGKPIVATSEGMRGFDDAVPGEHYFLARDPGEFADRIIDCRNEPDKASHVGQNARRLSEQYDWRFLALRAKDILMNAARL
jgi:glycosyltransferase involved in cell wall biosynthesis